MPVNLKNFALFEGVSDADLRPLAERAVMRTFPKQAIIINEGDIGDSLFMVVSGRVKVYLSDEHGKELILSIKGPGNYFGELALDENLRSASVMTLEPSQFAVLPRAEFKTFVLQHAEGALRLFQNLARGALVVLQAPSGASYRFRPRCCAQRHLSECAYRTAALWLPAFRSPVRIRNVPPTRNTQGEAR